MDNSQEFKDFNDFLRSRGMKFSQPRKTILKLFLDGESHKDIDELILGAKKIDSLISRSTVYRTMNLLVICGLADEINFNGERKYFENVSKKHHHDHYFCVQCKNVGEFHHPMIEKLQKEVAKKNKFNITSHRMILYGICGNCK